MKLNNKGFAISTIMYMILIMAIVLISLTLVFLSSNKLILDKSKQVAKDNIYVRLPKQYKEVEYIQSNGTQYIDTQFTPNQDTRVIVDFQYVTVKNSFLFGSRTSLTSNSYTVNIGNSAQDAVTSYGTSGNVKYATPDKDRHIIDKNKNLFYFDNNLIFTQEYHTFTSPGTLEIFSAHSNGQKGYLPSVARIYSFKIYDAEELVRDFVPCYRKSDKIVGLYDLVNDIFYMNASTSGGNFAAGSDIT